MSDPAAGNLFRELPAALDRERFDVLLERPGVRLERIVSTGHATPPGSWYDQDGDEWVAVLRGRAGLRLAGRDDVVTLEPGDWLLIPARCRHRVEWTDPDGATVWLALHLPPVDAAATRSAPEPPATA